MSGAEWKRTDAVETSEAFGRAEQGRSVQLRTVSAKRIRTVRAGLESGSPRMSSRRHK